MRKRTGDSGKVHQGGPACDVGGMSTAAVSSNVCVGDGLHQRSALMPFLFMMSVAVLTKKAKKTPVSQGCLPIMCGGITLI